MAAISCVAACESILGTFEVGPPEGVSFDASSDQTSISQGQVDAGEDADADPTNNANDGGAVIACAQSADCPAATAVPAGCAVALCKDNRCVYAAIDKDADGHPLAGCVANGIALPGDDCADDDPTVFPGGSCTKTPDGTVIVYPNGAPIGACKAGQWACTGGQATCVGAVGPAPAENCALKNDANCNGVNDEGCDCAPGTSEPCGNLENRPSPCKKGSRTCSPEGKWGACVGNVEPKARDCSSNLDNDCSSAPDKGEVACQCPGGVAQGATAACKVIGGLGICAEGKRACQPSPDKTSGVFGACEGPKPQARDCESPKDLNCDGTPDELEVGCGTPCIKGKFPVAAVQKFAKGLWGCPGTFSWESRGAGCSTREACSVGVWVKYNRQTTNPIAPTHKYWVAEQLGYGGAPPQCFVPKAGSSCGADSSMAVCPYVPGGGTVVDAENNTCNWSGCGFGETFGQNDYLGGCSGNVTGGTLCCP
ncbi:MAG TPA: hypothetical protein VM580_14885 [Labilithrix sp.]|nr:hypothetical protein [Labilithrix sp.]